MINVDPFQNPGSTLTVSSLSPRYDNWASSPSFAKLVAAYDMILIRSPAPWSLMRLTTVTTAYEACNALLSMNHFAKKLSLSVSDVMGYVLFREAAKDLSRMLKPGQEVEQEDSFFVHFRALGLSPKSPYSATAAPYFYNLVHLTGAYMGDPRSMNAVAMVDASINQIVILVGFLGDYFTGSGDFGLYIGADARAAEIKAKATGQTLIPQRSPARLLQAIKQNGNKMPTVIRNRFKLVAKNHGALRPHSIGEWIAKSL